MQTNREVLQMALEHITKGYFDYDPSKHAVIAALREALAQPEPEPDGYFYEWENTCFGGIRRSFDGGTYNGCRYTRQVPYYLAPTNTAKEIK